MPPRWRDDGVSEPFHRTRAVRKQPGSWRKGHGRLSCWGALLTWGHRGGAAEPSHWARTQSHRCRRRACCRRSCPERRDARLRTEARVSRCPSGRPSVCADSEVRGLPARLAKRSRNCGPVRALGIPCFRPCPRPTKSEVPLQPQHRRLRAGAVPAPTPPGSWQRWLSVHTRGGQTEGPGRTVLPFLLCLADARGPPGRVPNMRTIGPFLVVLETAASGTYRKP